MGKNNELYESAVFLRAMDRQFIMLTNPYVTNIILVELSMFFREASNRIFITLRI